MIHLVVIADAAKRGLRKAPPQVQRKFATWVQTVELLGLEKVRQIPGYHDEPLKGQRAGQRSIRLSKALSRDLPREEGWQHRVRECGGGTPP